MSIEFLTNNPITRKVVTVAIITLVLIIIISVLPAFPFPLYILTGIDWLFRTLWSLNFIIDIPTLLWWFNLAWVMTLAYISYLVIIFISKIYFLFSK